MNAPPTHSLGGPYHEWISDHQIALKSFDGSRWQTRQASPTHIVITTATRPVLDLRLAETQISVSLAFVRSKEVAEEFIFHHPEYAFRDQYPHQMSGDEWVRY